MRATLIHNAKSGSANAVDLDQTLAQLTADGLEVELCMLEPGQNPTEAAARAVTAGSELLIASGGDGTVSAVARAAIARSHVRLGILPHGTANAIASELGLPEATEQACAVIRRGATRLVDTATVNGDPMLLLATIGVHAAAITEASTERKKLLGPLAYVLSELQELVTHERFKVSVEADGDSFTTSVSALTVANMAPPFNLLAHGHDRTLNDDGLLDVTLVSMAGAGEALATTLHLAYQAVAGLPAERDNVGFFRASRVRIETEESASVMVDGDERGQTPLVVQCLPKSLRVVIDS